MIKGYIPNCVFEASNTAPLPLQKIRLCSFSPSCADRWGLFVSKASCIDCVQHADPWRTDNTSDRPQTWFGGGAGRQRESHLVVIVKPWSWAATGERLGTFRGGEDHTVNAGPRGLLHIWKLRFITRNSWNWLQWSAPPPSSCCLHLNHPCIPAARLIAQMRM